jgi:anti-repressor protein
MNQLVFIENGQAVTDSLTVAEVFGKRHADVIRDIDVQLSKLAEAGEHDFIKRNFALSNYLSGKRNYKKWNMTEDAFTLVAMSYVTPEAMKFKIRFIQEFRRIKAELEKQFTVPQTFSEALRLAADLQEKIERDKPKVEAHDRFISGENYQTMSVVAKSLGIGRNKLFALLRHQGILMSNNTPYQQYIDRGYFVVKEKSVEIGENIFNKPQTYVTAKGVAYLDKLLNKKEA